MSPASLALSVSGVDPVHMIYGRYVATTLFTALHLAASRLSGFCFRYFTSPATSARLQDSTAPRSSTGCLGSHPFPSVQKLKAAGLEPASLGLAR